jgi:hypothetical protein
MYHVELRQFPHNFCRFNLTERELRETILYAWVRGEWIELGERKWNPHQANLTVLEGPQLPVGELSMGRGWRNAERRGEDVTEQLLAAARAAASDTGETAARAVGPASGLAGAAGVGFSAGRGAGLDPRPNLVASLDARLAADSLGLETLAKLGEEPVPIAIAWQIASERYPDRPASDCLRLAELAIGSLLESGLVVLLAARGSGKAEPCEPGEQFERAMGSVGGWTGIGGSSPVLLRRK